MDGLVSNYNPGQYGGPNHIQSFITGLAVQWAGPGFPNNDGVISIPGPCYYW